MSKFIKWFKEISNDDVHIVGGKTASLGEMFKELSKKGVKIPNGFAITADAYKFLIKEAGIENKIKGILSDLNTHDVKNLQERGKKVRDLILSAELPNGLKKEILENYKQLSKLYKKENVDVAVRSSATAEDLPDASFAGQQETFLNVRDEEHILEACKKCFASLFTNRAISYRVDKGFDHLSVYLSICIQKMVRSDKASSGVIFSIDTESGFKNVVFITGSYGLGENIVQGNVNPDEFYVFKPTLKKGKKPILMKRLGEKKIKMIYAKDKRKSTKNIDTPEEERNRFCITEAEILELAKQAVTIEEHYTKKAGNFKPMDIEWAKDGESNELFITQARPETVQSQKDYTTLKKYVLEETGKVLAAGRAVGEMIGQGLSNVIKSADDIKKFRKGEVLVTDMTDPDWEPIMKIAAGIVTNKGGRTCFSGETKILTNMGFKTIKDIHKNGYEELMTPSLNINTGKIEWKLITATMKKASKQMKISISHSGKIKDNILTLTPDHKMINIRNSEIVETEISDVVKKEEMLCLAQKIPSVQEATEKDEKLAYLLGAIMTDGHIYRNRTHGEVQFIQKNIPEKQQFINFVKSCMTSVYGKSFVPSEKPISTGIIRGNPIVGQATAFRLYSKQIAYDMYSQEQNITTTLIHGDKQLSYQFLAGAIDGDGCFHNNRIHLYISDETLLEGIILACLRIGIFPQVTKNRNINHIQIVEKLDKILSYTKRVKGKTRKRIIGTRFFAAKQFFDDNVKGDLKVRRDKNLYIDERNLKKLNNEKINKLLNSDIRMQRAIDLGEYGYGDVYNITVADNHNYLVFTKKLTPVIVCNCHAAIISRELGIPCIVGCGDATKKIETGQPVTVSCAEGDEGKIYKGKLKFKIEEKKLDDFPKPKTKIMMNIGTPAQAFEKSFIPNDGVGLARLEFIINEYIRIHPLALLNFEKIKDKETRKKIMEITRGYSDKPQFFIDKLAEGISMIAAAFYPNDVIVRLSDFKTNEYANLIGGKTYEPLESNPMIGWRGASRYYSEKFKPAFVLECKALKKAREEFGLVNIKPMIPFCRTVEEGKKVIEIMKENGLKQGKDSLEIYVMCEIPSNVIIADQFAEIFDGFSIGSNDLTQLTLGLDRDSALVASVYDERNLAVKRLIKQVIEVAHKKKRKVGICGQAPSDFPEFAEFLVESGIDSISLNPDTVLKTTITIDKTEKKLGIK